ncbi:MAG: hypothetical protein ISQ32_04240, partial [Rickettsiales bacterium]|nr:hypothetical protein [Rickettsiales bacterium]
MQKNRLSNIKKIVKTLLIFQFFLIAHIVKAESFSTDHAKFTIIQEHSEVKAGAKSQLLIKVDLDKGWHSYWENPGDSGYPLAINLAEKSIFEITGKLSQNPEIIVIGDLINFGYSNTFYIKYNLQFDEDLKEKDYEQEFSISILVCKDVCIPETVEASLEIEVNDKNEINELFLDKIVQLEYLFPSNINNIVNYNIQGDEIVLAVENFANLKKSDEVYFFPFLETLIHYQASQNSKIADKIYVKLPGKNNTEVEQLKGILRLGNNYYNIDAELDQKLSFPIEEVSLIYVLKLIFYAIMGGLILNFMPCVFPVLSLKCLHIANCKNKHISEIKRSSFYYFLGIEVSFIIFAMLVVFLKNTGLSIGWGFHMQSVFFVGFLIILFYLIALNLSDVFNFDNFYLPNLNLKSTSESINSFFSGALMTIIATPCTAPFMAAAVGFAFTQDNHMIYLIFLALGLGLSLPVILISLNQSFIRLLPKSGRWLESFKQFLAFPFYLTTIWLLWIFNNLTNSELLFIFL